MLDTKINRLCFLLFGNHSVVGDKQEKCPKFISKGNEIARERLISTEGSKRALLRK